MSGERAPVTEGAWRALRGAVVGVAATLLAIGGHAVAGGAPPGPAATAAVAVLLGGVSVALSRARWTFPRLVTLLVVAQVGLHAAFVSMHSMQPLAGHAQHGASADLAAFLPTSWAMVAGHVVAAAATAALLSRGEQWLGGVVDALALRAVRLLEPVVTVYGVRARPVPVPVQLPPRQRFDADACWERGPPC